MKLSEHWLREWVNPKESLHELTEQLTMAGLEVESVLPVAGDFKNIVIGHVTKVEPHPNADRLRVCQVNIGKTEPLNIVCGGANVREGLNVAVAQIGATMPNGLVIKETKLRDVLSQGMICSSTELGLTENSEGIMELPSDAPIGKDIREWLQLSDYSIDVHVTPNRGDCLSVAGIAREVAVLNNCELKEHDIKAVKATIDEQFPVKVQEPTDCPRYLGRIIRGVNAKAPTPIWMQEKLRRSGVRSVCALVDVTNYVLLELGQPLHVFDLNKLSKEIIVRRAVHDEKIKLLNDQEITLTADTLVIADHQQSQAVAGIMGGMSSAVTDTTTDIFLESAFFNPLAIAGRARRYNLVTDSCYRFERGVDPNLCQQAMEYATRLLLEVVGGKAGPVTEVVHKDYLPKVITILLKKNRIQRLLGLEIPDKEVENILQRLGMQLEKYAEGWQVTAPSYRFDIIQEADLIEELVRIYGYQKVPTKKPQTSLEFLSQHEAKLELPRIRHLLLDRGYFEAITYSFVSPKLQNLVSPQQNNLELINPISSDLSVMRSSLWSGLLNTVAYNQNRQQLRMRLFETGLRFIQEKNEVKQEFMLAGILAGNAYPEQWGTQQRPTDFFDLKADVEALLTLTGHYKEAVFVKGEHPALHPGQTSQILYQNKVIGYIGALHPQLLHELDLIGPVYLFEMQLDEITGSQIPKFKSISKFPTIRRDISFWIDEKITIQQIFDVIKNSAGEQLNDLYLFDVYQGKGGEPGKRSLAIGLLWQHPDRTLVDSEVEAAMKSIINSLEKTFAVSLRE